MRALFMTLLGHPAIFYLPIAAGILLSMMRGPQPVAVRVLNRNRTRTRV